MPLYNFVCTVCEHEFEDIKKMNDPLPICPKCGGTSKLCISSPGLIRKKGAFPFKPMPPRPGPLPRHS